MSPEEERRHVARVLGLSLEDVLSTEEVIKELSSTPDKFKKLGDQGKPAYWKVANEAGKRGALNWFSRPLVKAYKNYDRTDPKAAKVPMGFQELVSMGGFSTVAAAVIDWQSREIEARRLRFGRGASSEEEFWEEYGLVYIDRDKEAYLAKARSVLGREPDARAVESVADAWRTIVEEEKRMRLGNRYPGASRDQER